MNRTTLPVYLSIIALALGGWAGWEHLQRRGLLAELELLKQERDTLARTASTKISLRSGTELNPEGPRGLADKPGAPEGEKDAAPVRKPDVGPMQDFAKMMKDPAMRDAMKAQARTQIDFIYRDLFELLALAPGKQEAVEKILMDRSSVQMTAGMSFMDQSLSEEERKAKAEEMAKATSDAEAKIKEEIGEEKFSQLKRYEDSQNERMQIKTFSSMLKDSGVEFPEETESKLMDAMFEERNNFKYDNDFSRPERADYTKLNEESLEQFTGQTGQLREKILARAETLLNPQQMEVFRKAQEQQAALEKMGMQWTRSMIKGSGEKKAAPATDAN